MKKSDSSQGSLQEMLFEPLFLLPPWLPVTAWHGHIPFLGVLFRSLRPTAYVDLGVHFGASLIAAAHADLQYEVKSSLFGVDTWEGDEHAGIYNGEAMYADLQKHFSEGFPRVALLRSTFDEARSKFEDGSVDLLHIDGFHTYEAVRHDFETWKSAMSDKGVVLFHDIAVYKKDFGVHRLWSELKQEYPSLAFSHSHGLGVLFVGRQSISSPAIRLLIEDTDFFAAYRSTVAQIAAILPLRSAPLFNRHIKDEEHLVVSGSPNSAIWNDSESSQNALWALGYWKKQVLADGPRTFRDGLRALLKRVLRVLFRH